MLLEFKMKDGTSKFAFKCEPERHPKDYEEIMPPNPVVVHSTWTAFTEYSMFDSVNSIHLAASLFIKEGARENEHKAYEKARKER